MITTRAGRAVAPKLTEPSAPHLITTRWARQELGSLLLAVSLQSKIDAEFNRALRLRDQATEIVISILRHKVLMQVETEPMAVESDGLWSRTIEAYADELRQTIAESQLQLDEARFELEFCERLLAGRDPNEVGSTASKPRRVEQ
jgi:hypothetical protein